MIQFRDGPFIRPHPAFWRIVLGTWHHVYITRSRLIERHCFIRSKLGLRACTCVPALPGPRLCENHDDLSRSKSRCSPTREKLRRGLHSDTCKPLGMLCMSEACILLTIPWLLECDRYFLPCSRSRLVWESDDSTGLLVLLGKFRLP